MVILNSNNASVSKRTFSELREIILLSLSKGQKTINQISSETGINWRTVENHLVHLVGKGLAREVVSSQYVRIFELSAFGKDHLRPRLPRNTKIGDNKIIRIGSEGLK